MISVFDKHAKHQINANRATENIIPPKQMERIIQDVFDDLARMIACTIGPAGGNTLVTEPYASTPIFPCKDGFRVMNNHIYNNPAYESIYRIIRDISGRMNEILGDATTSGVVIAKYFYNSIHRYIKRHKEITPYGIGNLLKITLEVLEKELLKPENGYVYDLKNLSKDKKVEVYKKIATISANNDTDIGGKVANIYKETNSDYAYIDIQKSMNSEDRIDVNLGFEMPYGYINGHMANSVDGITAEYDDPLFLLVDGPLLDPDLDNVKKFVRWVTEELDNPRPLVIIAGEYSKKVYDFLSECRTGVIRQIRGGQQVVVKLPVLAINFSMLSEDGVAQVQDLEAILGAKALQTNNGRLQQCPDNAILLLQLLGRADHVLTKYAYTRIRGGGGDEAGRKGRIAEIEKLIKLTEDDAQHGVLAKARLEKLKRRIGMLQGEMHCIYVGGESYKGKTNRSLIYEDATMAVKACIDNGVTLGGQVSIADCIKNHRDTIVENILAVIQDENNPVNIFTGKYRNVNKAINDMLDIISKTSKSAFMAVFKNASNDRRWIKSTFKKFSEEYTTFNLITNKFETFEKKDDEIIFPDLIVPGNTDVELLKSVFEIVNLFITSNQLISLLPKPKQDK